MHAARRFFTTSTAAAALALAAAATLSRPASASSSSAPSPSALARAIDHTVLKADALPGDIERLAAEAALFRFASVCVNSCYVKKARAALDALGAHDVKVCSVVGFPLGAASTTAKYFEALQAVADGAEELDMVIPVGLLKAAAAARAAGRATSVEEATVVADVAAVVEAAATGTKPVLVKVILETCLLTDAERDLGVEAAAAGGADFVKTSKGFSTGGATVKDVAAMAARAGAIAAAGGKPMQVKASGGIRTYSDAVAMLGAGASRLGCSAGVAIVKAATVASTGGGDAAAPAASPASGERKAAPQSVY